MERLRNEISKGRKTPTVSGRNPIVANHEIKHGSPGLINVVSTFDEGMGKGEFHWIRSRNMER
jgi:hypothetical protein